MAIIPSRGHYSTSVPCGVPMRHNLGDMNEWRQRFKDFAKEAEVTQDYLAEKLDVTQGTIAHWLSGRREINLSTFFKLCEFAGADPQRILFGARVVPAEEPGEAELKRLLDAHPNLRSRIARAPAKNDAVASALGPLPKRASRRRYPSLRKHKRAKTP